MAGFGYDENQLGSGGVRGSMSTPIAYFTGIVEDIIFRNVNGKQLTYKLDGSNLGEALVRIIPTQRGLPLEELDSAFPISVNIQDFPLVGEQVLLFKDGTTLYYMRLAVRRRLTDNKVPSMQLAFNDVSVSETEVRNSRELAGVGVPSNYTVEEDTKTKSNFISNPEVRPLRAYEGDMILQGRFGGAIRWGSSAFQNPDVIQPHPNLILTAGVFKTPRLLSTETITPYSLTEENINEDKSSIWIVSDQEVLFKSATRDVTLTHRSSTESFTGAQIFVNSDRVILNSKVNEIGLFANTTIDINAVQDISLNTDQNVSLRAIRDIEIIANRSLFLKAEDLTILATKNLSIRTAGDYGISGQRIFIGTYGDATQPMVLGTNLGVFMGALLSNLIAVNTALVTLATAASTVTTATVNTLNAPALALTTAISTAQTTLAVLFAGTAFTAPIPGKGAIFNSKSNFVSVGTTATA